MTALHYRWRRAGSLLLWAIVVIVAAQLLDWKAPAIEDFIRIGMTIVLVILAVQLFRTLRSRGDDRRQDERREAERRDD